MTTTAQRLLINLMNKAVEVEVGLIKCHLHSTLRHHIEEIFGVRFLKKKVSKLSLIEKKDLKPFCPEVQ